MKYRVELTAYLEATYYMELEADDETEAKQLAIERAPTRASMWEVLPSPSPEKVSIFNLDELEGEDAA